MRYEYTVELGYKIHSCIDCPMRTTDQIVEGFQSHMLPLNGTVSITRNKSFCGITHSAIDYPISVDSYNDSCPLRGRCKEIKEGTP